MSQSLPTSPAISSSTTESNPATTEPKSEPQVSLVPPVSISPPKTAAVIDIGVTSIRMAIAEIIGKDEVRTLESLIQPIDLGHDVFDDRILKPNSIEKAVAILQRFRQMLTEYSIEESDIRVVATTGVREAANSLAFTDRIYVATGLIVETIDEAEVNRITYVGVMPHLRGHAELHDGKTVVIEVGGGTTEMLILRSGNVLHSQSYRLGSLRTLKAIEEYRTGPNKRRVMLENHIRRTLGSMSESIRRDTAIELVALGGDIRFAAHRILDGWDGKSLEKIPIKKLQKFVDRILQMDKDSIVRRYGASFIEAETMGPALLVYAMLADEFSLEHLFVCDTNLRDGLLQDKTRGGNWTSDFQTQIIRAALNLGRRYYFDENHARNVAELSKSLFDQLKDQHRLDSRHEVLLFVAALLHEVGVMINVRSNHKHALYIIRNSELFGLSREELLLVGLVARYHRRAYPQPSHEGFATLSQMQRVVVAKLAAILRLAIALDDRRSGHIREVKAKTDNKHLIIGVPNVDDVSLEQVAMRENSGLFRDVFGMSVILRSGNV
jgi:exopolyphosphatase / guanosine-5'-triphosphate,3'-diphosphate pyrophosphatase